MKKKVFGLILTVLFTLGFLVQCCSYQKVNPLGIASQEDGESGILANNLIDSKKVYLTFDDGPSDHTDEILDILKKHHVKATFFVVGKKTKTAQKQYQRIVLEGHTLAMHSYSHNYDQIYSSVELFGKDLKMLQEYLYQVTEVKPFIYRFPGGSSNTCAKNMKPFIQYVNSQGLLYFDWNALSGDALDFSVNAEKLNKNILKDVRKQKVSIVLMHDLHETVNTVAGLDNLITTLKKEGYQILPITRNTKQIHHVSVDK